MLTMKTCDANLGSSCTRAHTYTNTHTHAHAPSPTCTIAPIFFLNKTLETLFTCYSMKPSSPHHKEQHWPCAFAFVSWRQGPALPDTEFCWLSGLVVSPSSLLAGGASSSWWISIFLWLSIMFLGLLCFSMY